MSTVSANTNLRLLLTTAEVFRTNAPSNSEPLIPLHSTIISLLYFIRKITYGKYKKTA